MKRILLALLPWMAMTSLAAVMQSRPADVIFTHMGSIDQRSVRVDDECYVSLDFLDEIGWKHDKKGDNFDLRAEDQKVRVPARVIDNDLMVPLRVAVEKLGGDTSWDGDHLLVLSPLKSVTLKRGEFKIEGAMSVKPKVFLMDDPNRVVLDIHGAKLAPNTKVEMDGTSRIAQFKPDVVRVVLETSFNPLIVQKNTDPTRSFTFSVTSSTGSYTAEGDDDANPIAATKPKKVPLTAPQMIQYDPASSPDGPPILQAGAGTGLQVGPLNIDAEGDRSLSLTLRASGLKSAPVFRRPDPSVIEIVLPRASVAPGTSFDVQSPSIDSVATRYEDSNLVVSISLNRPMGVEFSLSAAGLQIQLLKPQVGNGKLAGKTIVVDAGHGGHDNGSDSNGINEKDLTLKIAKKLSQKLAEEGATVIMSRKTDTFIELDERPGIANRNKAAFFISVHINKSGPPNSASGTMTFFHGADPISQLLGDCIQREIIKVNGLPNRGVVSDKKIYSKSGFAVLRGAQMPAVLIECGFINTTFDRKKMITDEFQEGIAESVIRGLKVFLGNGKKD